MAILLTNQDNPAQNGVYRNLELTVAPEATFTCNLASFTNTPAKAYENIKLCKGCDKQMWGKGNLCEKCKPPKPSYYRKGMTRGRGGGFRT